MGSMPMVIHRVIIILYKIVSTNNLITGPRFGDLRDSWAIDLKDNIIIVIIWSPSARGSRISYPLKDSPDDMITINRIKGKCMAKLLKLLAAIANKRFQDRKIPVFVLVSKVEIIIGVIAINLNGHIYTVSLLKTISV